MSFPVPQMEGRVRKGQTEAKTPLSVQDFILYDKGLYLESEGAGKVAGKTKRAAGSREDQMQEWQQ